MTRWWLALALVSAAAYGADVVQKVHGSGDGFAAPGVKLAWAVAHGKSEADTSVVVRVSVDTTRYPWLSVTGIDPFTAKDRVEMAPTIVADALDVRLPRTAFADYPNTEFRFYPSEAAARAGAPALVVFYYGVPDTAPEFASASALDSYLARRVAELR